MTLFEATHHMKREYNGNRMSHRHLDDVEVVFQDVLEDVRAMKRSRRHHCDTVDPACPVYPYRADPITG